MIPVFYFPPQLGELVDFDFLDGCFGCASPDTDDKDKTSPDRRARKQMLMEYICFSFSIPL